MAEELLITDEGLKALTDELEYLKGTKRQEVAEALKTARAFGDLSENSEYDEAKDEQAKTEGRIIELEEMLKNVKVISNIGTDVVNVGSRVKVYDETRKKEIEYSLVGSTEVDPFINKISDRSPIGSAIIGAKKGDKVTVTTPAGERILTILEISK